MRAHYKSISKIYFVIAVLLISTNLFAQNNLEFYFNKAIQNSPLLGEIKQTAKISELNYERDIAETSSLQSDLTANYLFAPYFNNNGKIISANPDVNAIGYDAGITNGGLYSVQLNFTKNLFIGGIEDQLNVRKQLNIDRSNVNFEIEQRNLKKQVTSQYLDAYRYLKKYLLLNDLISNLGTQLKWIETLVEKGYAKTTDYLLLKIELNNQRIAQSENLRQFKSNLVQLNSICGIEDTNFVYIDSVSLAISTHASDFSFLKQYEIDSMATINQQNLFETKYDPKVQLFFNTGLNAVEINNIQRKFGISAGINFQLPIFDGGQKNINRQKSKIFMSNIEHYKTFTEINIENQKKNSLSKIESIKKNLKQLNSDLEEYNKIILTSQNELKNGNLSMIEYLTILRNFIDLRQSKIEMEINMLSEINNFNYWNQ